MTSKKSPDSDYVSFGFQRVLRSERQELVNSIFGRVAGRYDVMNDLMSGGLHRIWKDELVRWLLPPKGPARFRVLDMAGGTGDISLRIARATHPNTHVTLCDISTAMLEIGHKRVARARMLDRITLVPGNAEALEFEDDTFDAYTIALGIRNVTDREAALREAYRVLKPGGRFICLEFSKVGLPVLKQLYDLHSFKVIPRLGRTVAGDDAPYRYLVESIRRFPDQETFANTIEAAAFEDVEYKNLIGGIAAIHSGWKAE